MKKILVCLILSLVIFMIYNVTQKKVSFVFSIGNKNGDIHYYDEDMHITEISMDILENEEIGNYRFQQILVKATTIQIDTNAIFNISSYERIVTQMEDLEELFILIRKYCKEKIEVILLKDTSPLAEYTNKKISILSKKYDIIITR